MEKGSANDGYKWIVAKNKNNVKYWKHLKNEIPDKVQNTLNKLKSLKSILKKMDIKLLFIKSKLYGGYFFLDYFWEDVNKLAKFGEKVLAIPLISTKQSYNLDI